LPAQDGVNLTLPARSGTTHYFTTTISCQSGIGKANPVLLQKEKTAMKTLLSHGILLAGLIIPAAAALSDNAATVKIDNFKFGPGTLTVTKGTQVTWTNEDDIPHSIVVNALGARSKALDTDKAYSFQFDKTGTYNYICGLHPFMHGTVVVN
jgi:plastocyanin